MDWRRNAERRDKKSEVAEEARKREVVKRGPSVPASRVGVVQQCLSDAVVQRFERRCQRLHLTSRCPMKTAEKGNQGKRPSIDALCMQQFLLRKRG